MTYEMLEKWMIEENPSFAKAVEKYYSLPRGKGAAIGEVRSWQALAQVLQNLASRREHWRAKDFLFYQEITARLRSIEHRITEAVRAGDDKYLRRLAACVKLLRLRKKQPEKYQFDSIEFVFEAYVFLRKRDGKGSPLPRKKEVKTYAALIQAFAATGLLDKLPKYLWDPVRSEPMAGPGLTPKEFDRIRELQAKFLRPETEPAWTYRWKQAGLKHSLRQDSPDLSS
jgi:hypothetical protein